MILVTRTPSLKPTHPVALLFCQLPSGPIPGSCKDVAEEMGGALLWRSWSYEEGQKEFELACTCTGARSFGTPPCSACYSPDLNA
jgi:hypothetical protein